MTDKPRPPAKDDPNLGQKDARLIVERRAVGQLLLV
jgi:hypothetical protein